MFYLKASGFGMSRQLLYTADTLPRKTGQTAAGGVPYEDYKGQFTRSYV